MLRRADCIAVLAVTVITLCCTVLASVDRERKVSLWPFAALFATLVVLGLQFLSRRGEVRAGGTPHRGERESDAPATIPYYPEIQRRVNGVFQGGGAKGVVYCGALTELRARGIWFRSVSGSSAGAITALLVAIGHRPESLFRLAHEAMQTIRPNVLPWVHGNGGAWFRVAGLREWLEARLRESTSVVGRDVLFADLLELPEFIGLNVVAMDLATRQPIVFNPSLTPNFSVAEAVVASCAIPMAMPPRRAGVRHNGKVGIHRLVDGGAWSNYPAFVYRDPSFRAASNLPPLASPNTLGLVIHPEAYLVTDADGRVKWPPVAPRANGASGDRVWNVGPKSTRFDGGAGRRLGWLGSVLTWSALRRLVLIVALPLAVLGLWQTHQLLRARYLSVDSGGVGGYGYSTYWGDPVWWMAEVTGWMGLEAAIAVAVVAIVLILILLGRFGKELADVGVPSALAAMSIGPGVPSWVGYDAAEDPVIRLSAPLGIQTTSFRAPLALRRLAVIVASHQAKSRITELYGPPDDAVATYSSTDPSGGVVAGAIDISRQDQSDAAEYDSAIKNAQRAWAFPLLAAAGWVVMACVFSVSLPLIVRDALRMGSFSVDPSWYLPYLALIGTGLAGWRPSSTLNTV